MMGEEYLAHMEIGDILTERHGEVYAEKMAGTCKDGNNLANESAYHYGCIWSDGFLVQ